MLFEKIDRLKILYNQRYVEEIYNPKHDAGVVYLDEKKKMRLSVESRNFVDALLQNVPFEIKSVEMLGSSDSRDAIYRVTFRVSFLKRRKIVDIIRSNAKIYPMIIYPMIVISDYDADDGNKVYIHINLKKCLTGDDKIKYEELDKKYETVQHELALLNNDFDKQIRDWEIDCIQHDRIEYFKYVPFVEY